MKSIRQKREEFAKEIRSKQRREIFAQNREKNYDKYEEESFVSLIFPMLDNDSEEINAETFDEFLEIISEEVLESRPEEKKINEGMLNEVIERFGSILTEFEEKVKYCDEKERIFLITEKNRKAFDMIRFFFRLQLIEERHLMVLDCLLNSSDIKLSELMKKLTNPLEINNFNAHEREAILSEIIFVFELRLKIHEELAYLCFLTSLGMSEEDKKNININLNQRQKQMIVELAEKWFLSNVIIVDLLESFELIHTIKESYENERKFREIFSKYKNLYLGFFVQNSEFITKIVSNTQEVNTYEKIVEFIFLLFSSLPETIHYQEIEISETKNHSIDKSLILFMDLSILLIKELQTKIAQNQKKSQEILENTLKSLVDCFVEDPAKVFFRFVDKIQTKGKENIIESFHFFNKHLKYEESKPLMIKLLESIEDFEYFNLLTFVELLSIIMSYNEPSIEILFEAPAFEGCYDSKLNFEIILEKKLLQHISGEMKRRALWMLSNIAGSEEFYTYALSFIKNFYIENILENDSISSVQTKEDALINESILQSLMNYLSNIRSFREIEELMTFEIKENENELFASKQNDNQLDCTKNRKESMFIWIIRNLALVAENLATNTVIMKNTEKFIEVLIYSLFNILTLEENNKSSNDTHQKDHIVLSIMESYSIPKNLEVIYQNTETTNQYSTFFTMMETLLDTIHKAKDES